MDINDFKNNLELTAVPETLIKLINFQNTVSDFEDYSEGFGVYIDDKSGLKSWSDNEKFLDRLFPFAQANGSGSFYSIWNDGNNQLLEQMPIVVFGDEGGVHIVAENILQLLQLLTFDSEISVDWDEAYFYKDEDDYQESDGLSKFLNWLKEEYGINPISNPNDLVEKAQKKYKENFDNWFRQYYSEE